MDRGFSYWNEINNITANGCRRMESRRVVITGTGVIAPNGIGIDNFWDSLVNGRSGVRRITHFDASSYPSKVAGEVKDFDPLDFMSPKSARRMDRFAQFAAACTKMAMDDANLGASDRNSDRTGIALGSALGGIPSAEEQHSVFIEKGLNRVDPLLAIKIFPEEHWARSLLNLVYGAIPILFPVLVRQAQIALDTHFT